MTRSALSNVWPFDHVAVQPLQSALHTCCSLSCRELLKGSQLDFKHRLKIHNMNWMLFKVLMNDVRG